MSLSPSLSPRVHQADYELVSSDGDEDDGGVQIQVRARGVGPVDKIRMAP